MSEAVVIMAAPNGARRGKSDHPALPVGVGEIAVEAARCHAAGAAILHLHVRDDDGRHSLDPGRYREAIVEVGRRVPEMVVQITTEAAGVFGPEDQAACVAALKPEATSVALREMAPDDASRDAAAEFYAGAEAAGTRVQHILYSASDVARLRQLIDNGVIPQGPVSRLHVLGRYAPPEDATPADLDAFLEAADGLEGDWTVCAFGRHELGCVTQAMRRGGHARVGFENNLHLPNGAVANGSAELVALAAEAASRLGRDVATSGQARRLLRIPAKHEERL